MRPRDTSARRIAGAAVCVAKRTGQDAAWVSTALDEQERAEFSGGKEGDVLAVEFTVAEPKLALRSDASEGWLGVRDDFRN